MSNKRVQVVISGRVQGVAFRLSCQERAMSLGVAGWVRNRPDGTVEGLFEGPAEAVDALVRWCHHGPPAAEVANVDVSEAPEGPSYQTFHVR